MNFRVRSPSFCPVWGALVLTLLLPAPVGSEPLPTGFDLPPLSLDPAFAVDGAQEIQIALRDYAAAGFFEASGEMVLFGDSDNGNPSNREAILLRLNPDGSQASIVRYPADGFGCSVPRAFLGATRLSGGDYLTGGYVQGSCSGIPRWFDTKRLTSAGVIVQNFDNVTFSNQLAYVYAVAEQADGRIVAAGLVSGSGFDATTYDFGVARFLANGTLDSTFGSNGIFRWDLENDLDYAIDLSIDALGRILVSGVATTAATDLDWAVLALDVNGALDTGFGNAGVFRYDRAGFADGGNEVVIHPSGRVLVSGVSRADANSADFTVIGLTANGQLDSGFGNGGIAIVNFGVPVATATAITVGPGGLIYVAGSAEIGGTGREARDAVVTVLRADGTPDPRFNGGVGSSFEFGDLPTDLVQGVDVDATGGRILITGFTDNADRTEQRFGAARLIGLNPQLFADGFEEPAP